MSQTKLKQGRYQRIREQLAELIGKTDDPVAHRATAAALQGYEFVVQLLEQRWSEV